MKKGWFHYTKKINNRYEFEEVRIFFSHCDFLKWTFLKKKNIEGKEGFLVPLIISYEVRCHLFVN
jgi:hypothetical protein